MSIPSEKADHMQIWPEVPFHGYELDLAARHDADGRVTRSTTNGLAPKNPIRINEVRGEGNLS